MKVFEHQIYEYKKGIRDLVLLTMSRSSLGDLTDRLDLNGIPYLVRPLGEEKANIYFGSPGCVEIVKSFGEKPLNHLSDEEDFILGIMLGYSRAEQYERYRTRAIAGATAR